MTFYELPVDIVTQILNFGLPAPIDVQIMGNKLEPNQEFAETLLNQMRAIPGAVDLRIQQPANYPKFHIDVDRTKSEELGFTESDVATDLLTSLSGSFQDRAFVLAGPGDGRELLGDFADAATRH